MFKFRTVHFLHTLFYVGMTSVPCLADNLDDARQITDRAMGDYYEALKRRGTLSPTSKKDIYDAVVKPRAMEAHEKRTGWLKPYLSTYGVEVYSHEEFFKKYGIEAASQKDVQSISEESEELLKGPAKELTFDNLKDPEGADEGVAEAPKSGFIDKADQAITGAIKAIKSVISSEPASNTPKVVLDGKGVPDKIVFGAQSQEPSLPSRSRMPADIQSGQSKVWYQDQGGAAAAPQKGADGQSIPNEIHFGR
jgi:hypothetical protein